MKILLDEKQIRKGRPIGLPYIGSKKKIAKKLIEIIKQNFGIDKTVYDLFGGGGAVTLECKLQGLDVVYNDIDPIPGQMIQKILSEDREYLKTLICSREEFFKIRDKENKNMDDYLKLLINSFGNNSISYLYSKKDSEFKYNLAKDIIDNHDCFEGYKQTETYKRFVAQSGKDSRLQQLEHVAQTERIIEGGTEALRIQTLERLAMLETLKAIPSLEISNKDYKEFSEIKDSIIYLDPPYKDTKKVYKHNNLNYEEFYSWCEDMSKDNIVLISGYEMPKNFECVYEFTKAKSTLQGGTHKNKYEKLYTIKN
ncbi:MULTISPECIES: DNA adenine methylase [Anaerococcus]|nr:MULTISPECIES: DNA adenine methylase [Anaerococcus]MBS5989573.1 DNA adenine methylase [Anaerococcus hydrogenalis]MDU4026548.1 DNA adenine methylase [Anaerococcus sp.]